ncbi:unnamed protein product [Prunus armeniaca]
MQTIGPKVDKSNSVGDACVSDLLNTNFLSSASACVKLVDHIHQISDLGTFSSLSLDKQKEATVRLPHLLLSSSYEKLLAKFDAYHKVAELSKFEAVIEAYKLDEDVEMFYSNMLLAQGVHINVVDIEVVKEQVANEATVKEDDAKEGLADEVATFLAEHATGAAKQITASDKHVTELGGAMEGAVGQAKAEEDVSDLRLPHDTLAVAYVSFKTFWQMSYVSLRTFWTIAYVSLRMFGRCPTSPLGRFGRLPTSPLGRFGRLLTFPLGRFGGLSYVSLGRLLESKGRECLQKLLDFV